MVRFFVSYHLHKYRLVSVIHRIKAAFGVSQKYVPYKYQSPTSIALQTETFNVVAANTYYKIFEQFVGGDSVNRLYKISAAAMYAGSRPAALKVTIQSQTAGSTETTVSEITADTDVNYLSADYIFRSYGGTVRIYASFKAVTNKGAAYLIIDQYKV